MTRKELINLVTALHRNSLDDINLDAAIREIERLHIVNSSLGNLNYSMGFIPPSSPGKGDIYLCRNSEYQMGYEVATVRKDYKFENKDGEEIEDPTDYFALEVTDSSTEGTMNMLILNALTSGTLINTCKVCGYSRPVDFQITGKLFEVLNTDKSTKSTEYPDNRMLLIADSEELATYEGAAIFRVSSYDVIVTEIDIANANIRVARTS